ncbi:chorismate--pyruvate lyase family protein [Colwellia sp. 20A7]|uniref:chorismate--pyruvate lyase family protein n=1 Tax=Colwellia sp. 20A7 TaxID=2689569 RepID=UPI00135B923B|nr:chorismate lyase [Colwellia sp. 20A7]
MNFQSFFPVTLSSFWHDANDSSLDENLKSWLLDPASLTLRLKSNCHQFRVELLGQKIEKCQESEAVDLIIAGEGVLVREVLLFCDDIPQVFARSLLPLSSLTGAEQALANLGTQSLGQVMFNNPSLKRKTIEVAEFDATSTVSQLANKLSGVTQPLVSANSLWGRRSIFILENKPLMVSEVFLPGAFAYQQTDKSGYKHV